MHRKILLVPLEEVRKQLATNERKDIKIVAPERLTTDLVDFLKSKGRMVKQEIPLLEESWKHSSQDSANYICESAEFGNIDDRSTHQGPFAISFANEHAQQDLHYHKAHWEIYYSDCPISAKYRLHDSQDWKSVLLKEGGLIIFGPNVVHKMDLSGLTCIIEYPSVADDKITIDNVDLSKC